MTKLSKPSILVKPTLDTKFSVDYEWWERNDEDLRTYLLSHVLPEQRDRLSVAEEGSVIDYIDPETGEVSRLDELNLAIKMAAADPNFINPQTSLVDSVFRVFLANGNIPQTPLELADKTGRKSFHNIKDVQWLAHLQRCSPSHRRIKEPTHLMSRVINTDSTGKKRNQYMRTGAELLRRLSQKETLDAEVPDMVSQLVFCLREIDEGIDQSARAWEKRDYWMKAEEFRQRWYWVSDLADQLQMLVFDDEWDRLPELMIKLLPHFSDIKVNKFMRKEGSWDGFYKRLLQEKPPERQSK